MKLHMASTVVLGALVAASAASAQTDSTTRQPTSTRRIPISKESAPGEVAPMRVDTVTMYRTDTVTVYQHDTVTVTRVDTVGTTAVAMPAILRQIGGFYIGVDGGAAVPTGNGLNTAQSTGWHVDVPLGWDPIGSPIGVRFAAGYSQFGQKTPFESFAETPRVFNADGDLKLRLPITSPITRRFQIYALGGATYNRYKNVIAFDNNTGILTAGDSAVAPGGTVFGDEAWHNAWGWNAGGGVQFGFGRTNLYVESRYIHFSRNGDLNQVPIVVGLNWY
ncbi:MAG TPA: hypothetical protein VHB25_00645 [Gemmatimonadaceae bacterium]|nr:hypothetical protein [Gemmatimonadaceae bacterium]